MKTSNLSKKALRLVTEFSDAAQQFSRDDLCSEAAEKRVEMTYGDKRARLEKYIAQLEKAHKESKQ